MNISPQGRAMIERFEGVVLHWYRDVAGIETGGVGHVLFLWPLGRGGEAVVVRTLLFFCAHSATLCLILRSS